MLAEIRSGKTVRAMVPTPPPALPEPKPEPRPAAVRTGARIGALPFKLVGTDAEHGFLAMGLAEEITSWLSRFRWLSIVSTSSLVQATAEGRDDHALRQTLGLDYLIDGTVQRGGDRIRITPRLIDLRDGDQVVWTHRFDRTLEDLLSIQDEVASETVAQIDPELLRAESRRAALVAETEAGPWDLMMRALPGMTRSDRQQFMASGASLRRVIERQPDLALAHTWLAYWFILCDEHGWASDRGAAAEQAARQAERGITLDPQSGRSFTVAGHIRALLERRLPEALSLHERALALNPNLAMAWALSGFALLYAGRFDEAEQRFKRYRELSPADPFAFQFDVGFALLAYVRGDDEKAAGYGRAVNELNPDYAPGCKVYLAALGRLGRETEAAVIRKRLLAFEPGFTLERFILASPFKDKAITERLAEGLRQAGISAVEPATA